MRYSKIKSFAKINLALNVIGKSSSLHKIESIVSFLDLHDQILIKEIKKKNHNITFVGSFKKDIQKNNTISKLFKILEKEKILQNSKFKIIVKKNIPSKAGLGGGSMNAACVLKFLIKKGFINISRNDALKVAGLIGSDVILGMYSKNLVLKSNKKIKEFSIKNSFHTLIVKPNFGCSTEKIYSNIKKFRIAQFHHPSKKMFDLTFLIKMKNDLETVAFNKYPKLNRLKIFLEKIPKVEFVRMTGSGSAVIAYFLSKKDCRDAEKKAKKQFRNYWCKISKTI